MRAETKFIFGVAALTIVLIVGGVFVFSRQKPQTNVTAADKTILLANTKNSVGNPASKVTIVEFGDYQCPACGAAHPIVKKVLEDNKGKVYFVFRNYPLANIHTNARTAAYFAEAASEQGKFWEMHDKLYENQKSWESLSDPKETFLGYSKGLGLNLDKLNADLEKVPGRVDTDFSDGNRLQVDATPTFFVNGIKHSGAYSLPEFQKVIDDEPKK